MKNNLIALFTLLSLCTCEKPLKEESTETTLEHKSSASPLNIQNKEMFLDIIRTLLINRNIEVILSLNTLNLGTETVSFLYLPKNSCAPCVVSAIEELKTFSEKHAVNPILFYDKTEKEEVFFKSEYNFNRIITFNLQGNNLHNGIELNKKPYYGLLKDNVITETLVVDSLLPSDIIQLFIETSL